MLAIARQASGALPEHRSYENPPTLHDGEGSPVSPLAVGAIMGHEFAGEVVALGRDAAGRFRVGERVTALPYIACGTCVACLNGQGHRCPAVISGGFGKLPGAYADFVRVGMHETLSLPPEVDFRQGALVEPLAVALHAVERSGLRPGEVAEIIGAGPIGLAVSLWSRFFGAGHVLVSDLSPERAERAARMGATAVIHAEREDVVAAVKREAGRRADVVFDCVGVPGSQQLAMDHAPVNGRVVVAGVCMQPDRLLPVKAITKELDVRYVFGYGKRDFAFTLAMLARARERGSAPRRHRGLGCLPRRLRLAPLGQAAREGDAGARIAASAALAPHLSGGSSPRQRRRADWRMATISA